MAYPTVGSEGSLVSWGSANFYATLLSRMVTNQANVSIQVDGEEVTGLDVEHAVRLPGLKSATVSINATLFATPKLGNVGNVAYSSGGYVLHLSGWELNLKNRYLHDITATAGPAAAPTWRSFRPDSHEWDATLTTKADSGTAPVLPHAPTDSLPTITFTYGDEATDDTFAGVGMIQQFAPSVQRGSPNTFTYRLMSSGALTPAGTTSPFGSSAFNTPLWSAGGAAAGAMVIATLTGSRTITITDSFWTSLNIKCEVGRPVELSAEVQVTTLHTAQNAAAITVA